MPLPPLPSLPSVAGRPRPSDEALKRLFKEKRREMAEDDAADALMVPLDMTPEERRSFFFLIQVRAVNPGTFKAWDRDDVKRAVAYLVVFHKGEWFPPEVEAMLKAKTCLSYRFKYLRIIKEAGIPCPGERDEKEHPWSRLMDRGRRVVKGDFPWHL